MDSLRPDDIAARVVAWHNRHPLARRIGRAQVASVGSVALPFAVKPGAALPPEIAAALAAATQGEALPPRRATLRDRTQARTPLPGGLPEGFARAAEAAAAAALRPPAPPSLLARLKRTLTAPLQAVAETFARLRRTWTRRRVLRPLFSEDFIPPLSRRRVAGWALRHGWLPPDGVLHGPLRRVEVDPKRQRPGEAVVTLVLTTAAVEQGSRRRRLLLAADGLGGAIGPRLLDTRRSGAASALALAGALAAAWPMLPPALQAAPEAAWARAEALWRATRPQDPAAAVVAAAPAAAPAAGASAVARRPGPPPLPTIAPAREALLSEARQARLAGHAAAGPSAGTHDQSGVHEAPPAALPPDDPPPEPAASAPPARLLRPALPGAVAGADRPARLALPPRPLIDEAARAQARREAEDLRAELAARRPPAPVATTPPPPPATVAAAAVPAPPGVERAARAAPAVVLLPAAAPDAAAPPAGTVWALTTRPLRTAAEAEQFIAAMRTLLAPMAALPAAPGTPTALQVERLPAGDDWRVVCWPFPRRADAERAAAVLAARGLRTQPVDF